MRWMKLEPIIQSEVSQKEKHKYSVLMHIYGFWKDGNNDMQDNKRHRCKEQTFVWTMWEKTRVGRFERIALKHVYYHI